MRLAISTIFMRDHLRSITDVYLIYGGGIVSSRSSNRDHELCKIKLSYYTDDKNRKIHSKSSGDVLRRPRIKKKKKYPSIL